MSAADWAEEVSRRWGSLAEEVRRRLGAGSPLEEGARQRFARQLGFDLGGAALHRGPFAADLARSLGADAVTAGGHVLGGEEALDSRTVRGAALLGHELTHVVQQTAPLPLGAPARVERAQRATREGVGMALPPVRPAEAALVQRAGSEGAAVGGAEGEARGVEAALLQAPAAGAGRPGEDAQAVAERVAERVYRRLLETLRDEQERAARLG